MVWASALNAVFYGHRALFNAPSVITAAKPSVMGSRVRFTAFDRSRAVPDGYLTAELNSRLGKGYCPSLVHLAVA